MDFLLISWSQLAFLYSGMLRETCFVTSGLTFTSVTDTKKFYDFNKQGH